jgi:hypothetical protein
MEGTVHATDRYSTLRPIQNYEEGVAIEMCVNNEIVNLRLLLKSESLGNSHFE